MLREDVHNSTHGKNVPRCPAPYVSDRVLTKTLSGCIHLARNPDLGGTEQQIAVKTVWEIPGRIDLQDVEAEALLHHAVRHPHITKFIAYGTDRANRTRFLATEYMAGGDLFDFTNKLPGKQLSPGLAWAFFGQLVSAVQYLHSLGIVHLDLCLENVLVSEDGHSIKLCDFGLARRQQQQFSTRGFPTSVLRQENNSGSIGEQCITVKREAMNYVVGRPGYMAPEMYHLPTSSPTQLSCDLVKPGAVDGYRRSPALPAFSYLVESPAELVADDGMDLPVNGAALDVFALGVILFVLLTNTPPWERPDVKRDKRFQWITAKRRLPELLRHWSLPQLSEPVVDLLHRMWSIDPEARPTASEIAQIHSSIPTVLLEK